MPLIREISTLAGATLKFSFGGCHPALRPTRFSLTETSRRDSQGRFPGVPDRSEPVKQVCFRSPSIEEIAMSDQKKDDKKKDDMKKGDKK